MKKQLQKSIATITLTSFVWVSLFAKPVQAFEMGDASRAVMLSYANITSRADSLSSLDLMRHLGHNLNIESKDSKEIFEVLDQAHLASRGKWAKAVSLDAKSFELSYGVFTAKVRYSNLDSNIVEINGKNFVLNPKKSLKQNAEAIVNELSVDSANKNGFYFVSKLFNPLNELFFPQAKAMSAWVWAGAALAVIGIIVAIIGLNKKKKAENERQAENSSQRGNVRAKHAEYISSRKYHDEAKKGHFSDDEESEDVAATEETVVAAADTTSTSGSETVTSSTAVTTEASSSEEIAAE